MGKGKDRSVDRATYNIFLQGMKIEEGDRILLTMDREWNVEHAQMVLDQLHREFPNSHFVILEGMQVHKIDTIKPCGDVLVHEGSKHVCSLDEHGESLSHEDDALYWRGQSVERVKV